MHQFATDANLAARERRTRFRFPSARPTHVARLALFWSVVVLLVGVAFALFWHSRDSGSASVTGPGIDYFSLLSRVDRRHDGLPDGLAPAWNSATATESRVSDDVRAVRIGALIADFEVVAWARNSQSRAAYYEHDIAAIVAVKWYSLIVARYARYLASTLDEVPGGERASELYRYLEHRGEIEGTVDPRVIKMARQASLRHRPEFVVLGNWLEASRIAARRGDGAYFRRVEVREAAQNALVIPRISFAGRSALQGLHDLILRDSMPDFTLLDSALSAALRAVAN